MWCTASTSPPPRAAIRACFGIFRFMTRIISRPCSAILCFPISPNPSGKAWRGCKIIFSNGLIKSAANRCSLFRWLPPPCSPTRANARINSLPTKWRKNWPRAIRFSCIFPTIPIHLPLAAACATKSTTALFPTPWAQAAWPPARLM